MLLDQDNTVSSWRGRSSTAIPFHVTTRSATFCVGRAARLETRPVRPGSLISIMNDSLQCNSYSALVLCCSLWRMS